MPHLAHSSWLSGLRRPSFIVELAVAFVAVALATGLRFLIDLFFRDVVLFPLVFPALAGATLLAGWRCGLMVVFGCQTLVWYFLMPARGSFRLTSASDGASLLLATGAQLLMLWLIARYRKAQTDASIAHESQHEELDRALARLKEQSDIDRLIIQQEAALQATRQNLEAIYHASGDGLALCEVLRDQHSHVIDYQAIEVNRAHAELTGATREQMLSQRVSTIYPPIDHRWFDTAEDVLNTGVMHEFDVRSRATGRWLNIRVSRVSDSLIQQTFVDISNRHRLEEQKQALLKEMSHRVMNNFQMIAGFLHMGAARADPFAKSQLKMAEHRVQVLAKLHSLLSYTESDGDINAGEFVKEICGYLASTVERPESITIVCETREIFMPADKVVPLGFVLTELVTNSSKYAYPSPMTGTIRVSLLPSPDGWVMTIEDEGVGLGHAKPKDVGGLGTPLVRRFIQQVGAELLTTSDNGTRHQITFKNGSLQLP